MRLRIAIRLDPEDKARPDRLEEARGLVDGAGRDAAWNRPFGRIRGNDFTLADAEAAAANIQAAAEEIRRNAESPFAQAGESAEWVRGLHLAADQAMRLAGDFLEDLLEDIEAADRVAS